MLNFLTAIAGTGTATANWPEIRSATLSRW